MEDGRHIGWPDPNPRVGKFLWRERVGRGGVVLRFVDRKVVGIDVGDLVAVRVNPGVNFG